MTQTKPPRKSQKSRWRGFRGVEERGVRASVEGEDEGKTGGEFAEGEDGDEGERVHAADVGLAVGDVHGSPEQARAERGEDAAERVGRGLAAVLHGAEAEHDRGDDDGQSAEEDFGDVARAGAFQFAEEQASPEDADQRVGVPEGEGDGEPDVADGEDGEGVGDGPEHAGEDGGDDEVPVAGEVGEDGAGAFEEGGECPAGGEDAGDHAEGDGVRREAGVDELGGGFRRAQPDAGGEGAGHAEGVCGGEAGGGFGRVAHGAGSWGEWGSVQRDEQGEANAETASGTRK